MYHKLCNDLPIGENISIVSIVFCDVKEIIIFAITFATFYKMIMPRR